MNKLIGLSILLIFFAFSFLIMAHLPAWVIGTQYETLSYIIWLVGFSFAFALIAFQR